MMIAVWWLRINEDAKRNGCNIHSANERDFAISTSRVDLALFFDRGKMLPLGEVFYPLAVSWMMFTVSVECRARAHP
jgi:hypothetical protein